MLTWDLPRVRQQRFVPWFLRGEVPVTSDTSEDHFVSIHQSFVLLWPRIALSPGEPRRYDLRRREFPAQ